MAQYKVIATITWKFESDLDYTKCLEHAKSQLDEIVDTDPYGHQFQNFLVQVNLAKLRDRQKLIHLGEFELDEVLPYITEKESKKNYTINGETHQVKMNSDRYFVFLENRHCVACNLHGDKMILDINPGDASPHFNLYGEENGRLVLMTKDHILAKSQGGNDELANYATLCSICNNLKGHYNLTYEQVGELRELRRNPNKLSRKALKDLINQKRKEMSSANH